MVCAIRKAVPIFHRTRDTTIALVDGNEHQLALLKRLAVTHAVPLTVIGQRLRPAA